MPDPAPLLSGEAVGAIVTAISVTGAGIITFLKWAVNQWLIDRKADREDRAEDRRVQVELQLSVQALVERDRIREERRRRESTQPNTSRVPQGEFIHEDTSVVTIKERLRKQRADLAAHPIKPENR
jgi:hypothetical protein